MQWSFIDAQNGPAKKAESLENMRKYLDLTDQSFDSRLRYAQFLVYASDFVTLGKEVATLNAPDPNNPKTFIVTRMRGYSAVENKAFEEGVRYMNELFSRTKDTARVIGSDYLYLGKAQQAIGKDSLAYLNISKAVALDSTKVDALAEIGKKYFDDRNYAKAAEAYGKAIVANSKDPNLTTNRYYFGVATYFTYSYADRDGKNPSSQMLVVADSAFAKVNELAPDYETAYLYRARVNKNLDDKVKPKGIAIPFYEKYIQLVTVTQPEKAATATSGLIEAYNNLGAYATDVDNEKAKMYFNKTLALDPQNTLAKGNLKYIASKK